MVPGCTQETEKLGGGKCLAVRRINATASKPQRGADGIDRRAECAPSRHLASRESRVRQAPWQAVSNLVELNNKTWVQQNRQLIESINQQATKYKQACRTYP